MEKKGTKSPYIPIKCISVIFQNISFDLSKYLVGNQSVWIRNMVKETWIGITSWKLFFFIFLSDVLELLGNMQQENCLYNSSLEQF